MRYPHIPASLPPTPLDENAAKVRAAYNAVADKYDSSYSHPKDIAENEFIRRTLTAGGFIGGDVLDAGCGTGFLLDQLSSQIAKENYVGIDISDGMLAEASRKHADYLFLNRSMEASGLPADGVNSVISLFGCFNYCVPAAALADMLACLKPDGVVFLMVCTPRHVKRQSYVLKDSQPDRRFYTSEQLRREVSQFFSDVQIRGMSFIIDYLPRWLPQAVFHGVMWLEQWTVARWFPSRCYYLIMTAKKNAKVIHINKR